MEDSMLCYREPADPRTYGMDLFDSGPDESSELDSFGGKNPRCLESVSLNIDQYVDYSINVFDAWEYSTIHIKTMNACTVSDQERERERERRGSGVWKESMCMYIYNTPQTWNLKYEFARELDQVRKQSTRCNLDISDELETAKVRGVGGREGVR